jgi:hypothetical protein
VALSRSRHVASAFAVALALGVGSSALLARDGDALESMTTFTVVDGSVLVRHGDAGFTAAREGELVAAGDTVRTATGASVELTYFEGSSVRIEADSEILVESLRAKSNDIEHGVSEKLQRIWHVVIELVSGSSRYDVRTPTSTASVRG